MRAKVIFVSYKKIERFEYEKYGGTIFEKYFDFEVWNLPKIFLNPEAIEVSDAYEGEHVRDIQSLAEFVKTLGTYDRRNTFMSFIFPPRSRETYYLEAIVSILGFKYSMSYCQPYLSKNNIGRLKDDFELVKMDYCNAILNALFPPVFNFVATVASYREFPSALSIKHHNNILIHTLDYDNYLKIKDEQSRVIEDRYVVFVDECYVSHVDYKIFGVKSPFKKPEDYYEPMRELFDMVEEMYGCKVVVAGHPRGNYEDASVFGNRQIIKGDTARLIKDAELVLCHTSTALDYIILFKKKFVLLYLDQIKRFFEWDAYYAPLIQYLKITPLNISRNYEKDNVKEVTASGNSRGCKKYMQQFIKQNGTKEALFFDVVAEHIAEYFEKSEER